MRLFEVPGNECLTLLVAAEQASGWVTSGLAGFSVARPLLRSFVRSFSAACLVRRSVRCSQRRHFVTKQSTADSKLRRKLASCFQQDQLHFYSPAGLEFDDDDDDGDSDGDTEDSESTTTTTTIATNNNNNGFEDPTARHQATNESSCSSEPLKPHFNQARDDTLTQCCSNEDTRTSYCERTPRAGFRFLLRPAIGWRDNQKVSSIRED